MVDLDTIKARNENCLIIGDCNRAIGAGNLGIPGNHPRVSFGGTLVRELLEDQEYTLVNGLDLVQGGPWTWESAADSKIRSCLDLVIVSAGLLPHVSSLVVDSERKITPARVSMRKGMKKLIPTDHFPLKIVLTNLPKRRIKTDQESSWNLQKPGGWEKYEKLSNESSEDINKLNENDNLIIEELAKKITVIVTKVRFRLFGKTKPKKKAACKKTEEIANVFESLGEMVKLILLQFKL